MCLWRLAEVAAHTTLEAINNHEGTTSNDQTQYQLSLKVKQLFTTEDTEGHGEVQKQTTTSQAKLKR